MLVGLAVTLSVCLGWRHRRDLTVFIGRGSTRPQAFELPTSEDEPPARMQGRGLRSQRYEDEVDSDLHRQERRTPRQGTCSKPSNGHRAQVVDIQLSRAPSAQAQDAFQGSQAQGEFQGPVEVD